VIRAAIDIGSNSTLFLVAQLGNDGHWRLLEESITPNGLGWNLTPDGGLSAETQDRNLHLLRNLISRAKVLRADTVRAVGTAALRNAVNTQEFLFRVRAELNLEIQVITGEDEARYTFLGALLDFPDHAGPIRVVDVGGGSSECVCGDGTQIMESVSLPLGAVSVTQNWMPAQPLTSNQVNEVESVLTMELVTLPHSITEAVGTVVAVGGTASTLAAQILKVHLSELWRHDPVAVTVSIIKDKWRQFAGMSVEDIATLPYVPSDRAPILAGGAAVLWGILNTIKAKSIYLSNKGLRWGLLVDDTIMDAPY
jgi:exopolyphosphatase/guanosine-5'-triphosphate,3'-diphosphate pyrophosphatase